MKLQQHESDTLRKKLDSISERFYKMRNGEIARAFTVYERVGDFISIQVERPNTNSLNKDD